MSLATVRIRDEGDKVLLVINDKSYLIPWEQALVIARGIRAKAKKAEEFAKANRIIADHALLTRAGFPIGLSDHPRIKDEVRKEAAWNSELRRALPGGVRSREVFGTPAVRNKPRAQTIAPAGVATAEGFGRLGGR